MDMIEMLEAKADDLTMRVEEVESINQNLKDNLKRKYEHCARLKEKNRKLKSRVEYLTPFEPPMPPPYLTPLPSPEVLESQSGMGMSNSDASGPLQSEAPIDSRASQQNVGFHEETGGWTMSIDSASDATMDQGLNADNQLGNFLQRPIRIATISWDVNSPLLAEFNPWELLHDNPIFNAKIQNYELLRHKLCLKFVISGTQFHYGRVLASYNPYFFNDEVTKNRVNVPQDLINSSQKPHIWLDPANNQGGELCLPFFYPRNFVSITQGDHRFLGKIDLQSTQPLRHANGGDDSVNITVFAWAEDVKLSVPTQIMPDAVSTLLESQSGMLTSGAMDEYGTGIVSKPASAVAKAAGRLSQFPRIGPYARASEMVASTVAGIATLFGMSRPAVITNPQYIKPQPTGNLPNVDTHETVTKLSLDSKNEVTIDPRVVGLEDKDEMGIVEFVKRESYLCSFDMSTSLDGVDKILFESRVTPTLFDTNDVSTNSTEYHLTPCAFMANAFDHWHGSITYKFQIVKSKFHKGKILVQYDPSYFSSATSTFNTNYSRIIDLASEDEFEVTIGWCQSKPWLKTRSLWLSDTNWSTDSSYGLPDYEYANGMIKVSVLNKLVSPSVDSDISFNVFIRMEDDAKFAQPTVNNMSRISYLDQLVPALDSQSGETTLTDVNDKATAPVGAPQIDPINKQGPSADQYCNVFFGESPTTLRELLKRYVKSRVIVLPDEDPDDYTQFTVNSKIAPFQRGYDTSSGDLDESALPFTFTQMTFLSYFAPCFAGWRGSLRKKLNFPPSTSYAMNPSLNWGFPSQSSNFQTITSKVSGSTDYLRNTLSSSTEQATSGLMTTNLGINDTLEVEFPYYKDERFITARALKQASLDPRRYRMDVGIARGSANKRLIVNQYEAVGDDFSLHFFTGVPIIHVYATPPAS